MIENFMFIFVVKFKWVKVFKKFMDYFKYLDMIVVVI